MLYVIDAISNIIISQVGADCNMTQAELFTKQQEYITRIQAGERNLIAELWNLLLPLTHKIINRYLFHEHGTRLYEEGDLLSLSYIALCAALDGYDSNKGAFSTYYYLWIQNTTADIRGTRKRHDVNRTAVSFNIPLAEDSEDELLDLQADEAATEQIDNAERRVYIEQLRHEIEKCNAYLTEQERQVIHARYYDRRTLEETGADMGLSRERVHSIETSAMRKYRQPHKGVNLRQFYDYGKAYRGTSLQSFRRFGTSSVERFAEYHEEWEERFRRMRELRTCGRYVSYGKAQAYINGWTDSY